MYWRKFGEMDMKKRSSMSQQFDVGCQKMLKSLYAI